MNYVKITTLFVLLAVSIAACKKHENSASDASGTTPENYLPTTAGSYFVYNWYKIDSNQTETVLTVSDTLFVLGDTTFNQHTYVCLKGNLIAPGANDQWMYWRDSSGYIVNQAGAIQYAYTDFTNDLEANSSGGYSLVMKMTNQNVEVNGPAGSFQTIVKSLIVSNGGNPVTNCGDLEYELKTYYGKQVGIVKLQTAYISGLTNCEIMEERLQEYYIP